MPPTAIAPHPPLHTYLAPAPAPPRARAPRRIYGVPPRILLPEDVWPGWDAFVATSTARQHDVFCVGPHAHQVGVGDYVTGGAEAQNGRGQGGRMALSRTAA